MDIQYKKGVIEIGVLSVLMKKDCYGYELVETISERVPISEGTVYPILYRFRDDGLVTTYLKESTEGPPRKYYQLTTKGKNTFKQQAKDWREFNKQINLFIKEAKDGQKKVPKRSKK